MTYVSRRTSSEKRERRRRRRHRDSQGGFGNTPAVDLVADTESLKGPGRGTGETGGRDLDSTGRAPCELGDHARDSGGAEGWRGRERPGSTRLRGTGVTRPGPPADRAPSRPRPLSLGTSSPRHDRAEVKEASRLVLKGKLT